MSFLALMTKFAIRATASACLKDSVYFTQKNLLFLFYTITFTKHPHQFIYFTRHFNKIFIIHQFLLFSLMVILFFFNLNLYFK